jgi:hypothetical protein
VHQRFADWMIKQTSGGRRFKAEQRQCLEAIRDHIAESLAIEPGTLTTYPSLSAADWAKPGKCSATIYNQF